MNRKQKRLFDAISKEYALEKRDASLPISKRFAKTEVRDIIRTFYGNFSDICRTLECTRSQFEAYLDRQPDLRKDMSDAKESLVDRAENVMASLMESENDSVRQKTAEFILKTLGKGRGWGQDPTTQVNVSSSKVDIRQIFGT